MAPEFPMRKAIKEEEEAASMRPEHLAPEFVSGGIDARPHVRASMRPEHMAPEFDGAALVAFAPDDTLQ